MSIIIIAKSCINNTLIDLVFPKANYADPQTKLRFTSSEEFSYIRLLPTDVVTGYLALRKASCIVPWRRSEPWTRIQPELNSVSFEAAVREAGRLWELTDRKPLRWEIHWKDCFSQSEVEQHLHCHPEKSSLSHNCYCVTKHIQQMWIFFSIKKKTNWVLLISGSNKVSRSENVQWTGQNLKGTES